jgi:beta-glucosidase
MYTRVRGLSYTKFHYGQTWLSASMMDRHGTVRIWLDVTNTGSRAGDEVVQLHTHQRTSGAERPADQLRGFQRVHLEPGQTKRVTFSLAASDLRRWDAAGNRWVVEDATHDVLVGSSAAGIRSTAALRVQGEVRAED